MTGRRAAVKASALTAAAVVVVFVADGRSDPPRPAEPLPRTEAARERSSGKHPRGVVVGCSRWSAASFSGALTDPRNLIVGPLVLVGGTYTPASTVRKFGGNKFPLLVKAGHTVTVRVARGFRGQAGLFYGRGGVVTETRLRDTDPTVTFVTCPPSKPPGNSRPEGPSGSDADGERATFWAGFVLARAPSCVPLEVFVDDDPSPRRVGLALGRRCPETG
jgi:hypothetical protein